MESRWSQTLPCKREKAIDELVRGHECAKKLKYILNRSIDDDQSTINANNLVKKVLISFTNTLSLLEKTMLDFDETFQFPTPMFDGDAWKFEDSDEDRNKRSKIKERRRHRKTSQSPESWTTDTTVLVDDGHVWRKYGQKQILNSKYPRNYFRCTHKYEQNCQATKQVQRISEEPRLYRTTYYGNHTCNNLFDPSQLVTEVIDIDDVSNLISFNTRNTTPVTNKGDNSISFASFKSIQQEPSNKKVNNVAATEFPTRDCYQLPISSSDYMLFPDDLSAFPYAAVTSRIDCSSTPGFSTGSEGLDMDLVIESLDDLELLVSSTI